MNNLKADKSTKKTFYISFSLLILFVLWTVAVKFIDVKPLCPDGSYVGLASINSFFRGLIGYNKGFYNLTEFLGLIPFGFVGGFAIFGLVQAIKRKSLLKVDSDIIILGCFYVLVVLCYVLFEMFIINYRPIIIDGILEASYPSTHTLIAVCVLETADMQLRERIRTPKTREWVSFVLDILTALTVLGRLISGVHWFTDIVGGLIFSIGLVFLYKAFVMLFKKTDAPTEEITC